MKLNVYVFENTKRLAIIAANNISEASDIYSNISDENAMMASPLDCYYDTENPKDKMGVILFDRKIK